MSRGEVSAAQGVHTAGVVKPRIGFVGVGWIGRHRLAALADSDLVEIAGVADPVEAHAEKARQSAPGAAWYPSLEQLVGELDLDGVAVATPSALHAGETIQALENGLAVFCQKPLGLTAEETRKVVGKSRTVDRLVRVDMSYRRMQGIQGIRRLVQEGAVGSIFAAELTFHNAYGPDKSWFYDPEQSGGGCLIDLGIHLVDLALWTLGFPTVENASGCLFAGGESLKGRNQTVEDYATARLDLATGTVVDLSCSWNLPAGRDAVIEATFYGTEGGLHLRNVDGSFYDFVAERFYGTQRERIAEPPDEWGGRAILSWARRLQEDPGYDSSLEQMVSVAEVIDRIYASCAP